MITMMLEEVQQQQQETPLLDLQELKAVSVLGRGAKGIAFLIRNENHESLALKVISKSSIEKKRNNNNTDQNKNKEENNTDLYKRIWFEKDVLNSLDHPLLPKLRGVLLADDLIGFAMDYCSGGDLNALRKQQTEKMFSNDVIRFYAAELVLVLDYLHKLGIIYRDLKPENILIQENGHLMIVDFDLSTRLTANRGVKSNQTPSPGTELKKKKNRISRLLLCKSGIPSQANSDEASVADTSTESVEKSNSFVGTEEYVAPEIILGDGHDFAVDWWSLGVVLYEMLYGRTPFRGVNRKETFYRILSKSPELVGEQTGLRDLIGKLLEKDPAKRISVEEIKGHDYFDGVNWDTVLEISRPPNIPPTKWNDDIDLEEMDGLDVQLVAGGLFEEDKVRKEKKIMENCEKKDNNVWVEGLKTPPPDNEFLIF